MTDLWEFPTSISLNSRGNTTSEEGSTIKVFMELPIVQNKPEVASPIPATNSSVDVVASQPVEQNDVPTSPEDEKTNPAQVEILNNVYSVVHGELNEIYHGLDLLSLPFHDERSMYLHFNLSSRWELFGVLFSQSTSCTFTRLLLGE